MFKERFYKLLLRESLVRLNEAVNIEKYFKTSTVVERNVLKCELSIYEQYFITTTLIIF